MAILENVLLSQAPDGRLTFTAATLDSQLTIPAPLVVINGKFEAPVAFPATSIVSYLSTLPDCAINLTFNADHTISLEYCTGSDDKVKQGKVKFTYCDGNDFPKMTGVGDTCLHICLPVQTFSQAIDQAQHFCANDELRMVLNTLCIDVAEDMSECYLVSTNGHALIKYTHTNNEKTGGSDFYRGGTPAKILIHNRFFKTLSAFASYDTIDITFDGRMICFSAGDIVFLCKAIEGNYPNYDGVIPKNSPYFVCFDKKEMLSAIKRVSIFGSESSKLIKIEKSGMFLNVSAQDIDFSTSADDQVFISNSECADGFSIGFSSVNLPNAIAAINSDTVRMQLSDSSRACVLTADDASPKVLTLCMPMLISD